MTDVNQQMISECPFDAVLFDIGANKGLYTKVMADKPSSKVYAFEPEPTNLKDLREHIKDKHNVEIHGMAISDHTGVDDLLLNPSNPGGHSMRKELDGKRWGHKLTESIKVAVITLDDWCDQNEITRVDGIKIDVEAHEEAVISGAKKTLQKFHPLIALETHQTIDVANLRALLSECGYDTPEDMKMDMGYLLRPRGPEATPKSS